jgi:tetratricopeptide (TPR) repeat protein
MTADVEIDPPSPAEADGLDAREILNLIKSKEKDLAWLFRYESWVMQMVHMCLDRDPLSHQAYGCFMAIIPNMMTGPQPKEWYGLFPLVYVRSTNFNNPELVFDLMHEWMNAAYLYGMVTEGDTYLEDALDRLKALKLKPLFAEDLRLMLKLNELRKYGYKINDAQKLSDDLDEIAPLLEKSYEPVLYVSFYHGVAQFLRQTEQKYEAFEYQQMAFIYSSTFENRPIVQARTQLGLAQSYRQLGKDYFPTAKKLYLSLEKIIPKPFYRLGYMARDMDLGSMAMDERDFDTAIDYFQHAVDEAIRLETAEFYRHQALFGLGVALTQRDRFDEAVKALKPMFDYWEDQGFIQERIRAHHALGDLYGRMGKDRKARKYFESALKLCDEVKLENMRALDRVISDLKKALGYLDDGKYRYEDRGEE